MSETPLQYILFDHGRLKIETRIIDRSFESPLFWVMFELVTVKKNNKENQAWKFLQSS